MTVVDFNVCTKDGDFAVLQLNPEEGRLYLYQAGTVLRSHSLLLLLRFSSTEDSVKFDFLDGELEVETVNTEEKVAIFEILIVVFNTEAQTRHSGNVIKTGELECNGNDGMKIRCHVEIHHGFFTSKGPRDKRAGLVVDLWKDTCNVEKLHNRALSVSTPSSQYCFQLCSEETSNDDLSEWIEAFETAQLAPRLLTRAAITAAVVSSENVDEDKEEETDNQSNDCDTDCVDGVIEDVDEDVVDIGDVEGQAAMFMSSLPWRRRMKKKPREPTDDEEFVIIELMDVLEHRAQHLEQADQSNDFKTSTSPDKNVPEIQTQKKTNEEPKPPVSDVETTSQEKTSPTPVVPLLTTGAPLQEKTSPTPVLPLLTTGAPLQEKTSPTPVLPLLTTGAPLPPPPPPPPPGGKAPQLDGIKLDKVPSVPMKQAHWSKVPSSKIERSLWSEVKNAPSNIDLKLLDNHFFVKENTKTVVPVRGSVESTGRSGEVLLDHRRVQILGIVFKRPYDRVVDRLKDAITSTTEVLKVEKLRDLKKLVPNMADMELYKPLCRDQLLPVDRFMKDLCEIPELGVRIDLTIHVMTFLRRVQDSSEQVSELTKACREVTGSCALRDVLVQLREVGNYMNAARSGGYGVKGFLVTSLDKVLDIKNTESGFTVLDFLVTQLGKQQNKTLLHWPHSLKHAPVCSELCLNAVQATNKGLMTEVRKWREETERLQKMKWNRSENEYFSNVQSFLSHQEVEVKSLSERFDTLRQTYTKMLDYLGEPSDRKSCDVFSAISEFMRKFTNARE